MNETQTLLDKMPGSEDQAGEELTGDECDIAGGTR